MFHVLIESGAHPGERRAGWTVTSVAAHAALVAVAVILTLKDHAPPVVDIRIDRDTVFWVDPVVPSPKPSGGGQPTFVPESPRIPIPTIHIDRPLIGSNAIVPTDLWEVGPASGTGVSSAGPGPSGVYTGHTVDRPVIPRSDNGSPIYPAMLRSAGLEGDVAVRFVVDSTGRVETSSIAILEASHAAFGDAVSRWLLRARYQPAEVAGRPVRQLVEQRFGFTLRR